MHGSYPRMTAVGSVQHASGIGAFEPECGDFDGERVSVLVDHTVAAGHHSARGLKRATRGVTERLARLQRRLFPYHARPFDLLEASFAVGNPPMAMRQLNRGGAEIGDLDRVGPEIAIVARLRAVGRVLGLDGDLDLLRDRGKHPPSVASPRALANPNLCPALDSFVPRRMIGAS